MEALKALFKRSGEPPEQDERSAEMRLQTKAWQKIYTEISSACDDAIHESSSKKKHRTYALPAEPLYLDLVHSKLTGSVIVFDHGHLISRAAGEITNFKTWHRCSFVCNDESLYLYPAAIFTATKPIAKVDLVRVRIVRTSIITSGATCLCLDMNSVDEGGCIFTLAFPTELSMTQFYKVALKASLIASPPTSLTHAELLSLMFRNSADVRERVLNFGIPDTMRAAFWSILSGAEIALERNPGLFDALCARETQNPLEKSISDKIRRDIHRTFPEDRFFQSAPKFASRREEAENVAAARAGQPSGGADAGSAADVHLGQGQEMLLVVNRAYSLYDKAIGYCQGMNFIVAGIVMHQRKPELIFWILERIMNNYRLGTWFVISTPDLSIALFRVTAITQMQNSRLFAHYVKHGVDIGTTVCHKWIVTMFIDPFHSLSPEFAYRILDMFFVHGPNFLVRLAVALIVYKPHAAEVLSKGSFEGIINSIRSFCVPTPGAAPFPVTALFKLAMSLEWDEEELLAAQNVYVEKEVKLDHKPPDWFLQPTGSEGGGGGEAKRQGPAGSLEI